MVNRRFFGFYGGRIFLLGCIAMKLFFRAIAASVIFLSAVATQSSAATLANCAVNSGLPCLATGSYLGPGGNDHKAQVEMAIGDALGLSSLSLTLLGKSDDGGNYGNIGSGQSGTWDTGTTIVDYITIKAAKNYTVYATGGATSGSWSTMGITNGGGKRPGVSHISFWAGPPVASMPVPAAGWMLMAGFGGLWAAKRRKR